MNLFNLFRKEKDAVGRQGMVSYVSGKTDYIKELLKGLVAKKDVMIHRTDIEAHPFEYDKISKLIKKFGILSAIIDKHVDFVMSGGINVKCEDERAKTIIEDFMRDFEFDSNMRIWLRQAFAKGFSPMELSFDDNGSIDGMKLLKSDNVFVKRDDFGVIEEFRQYMKKYNTYDEKYTPFKPNEIADLNINTYDDEYYGYGIIYLMMGLIDDLLGSRKEMHTIMKRKANNPLIFIGGDKTANNGRGEYPSKTEMDDMGSNLEWLNNKHEWTITDFWKPTTLDFGNIGDKFEFIIENDIDMLYSSAQIPAVIMGRANIPEGLANVQMQTWMFRIQSIREQVEKVIEQKMFKPVLNAQGIDEHVEVEWGLPTTQEKESKARVIIEALKNPLMSMEMMDALEKQLAQLLDISPDEIETDEEERAKEEKQKQPQVPGSNAKQPSSSPPKTESCGCHSLHESYTIQELEEMDNMTIKEFVGFNYSEYEDAVLKAVNNDSFEDLRGYTKTEFAGGLLNNAQISNLRSVLYDGFRNNISIREIAKELKNKVNFTDRYRMKDGDFVLNKKGEKILSVKAERRPIMIARSETIRLSNLGAIDNYKQNDIHKVRWVSALSDRTCPECSDLNGIIFEIGNNPQPPLHTMCRCSLSPFVEE